MLIKVRKTLKNKFPESSLMLIIEASKYKTEPH